MRGRIAGRSNWSIALRCLLRPLSCRMMNYRRFQKRGSDQADGHCKNVGDHGRTGHKTEPYLNLWFGILMAVTAVGYGIWTFVVGSSDSYYNFMLIGATLLLVGLWILVSVRIVYLLRCSQNKGKGLGKKKGIRFLTIFILVLAWCFVVVLSLVIFVGAGSDIHTQWEAMKTEKQQESQNEIYHNGTEISTETDIKNQSTENTETVSEIIEDTELKPDQSNIVKSGPITDSEYASFQITADASSVEGFDVFDDYAETMEKNFIGTWYCPSWGMRSVFRKTVLIFIR